MIYRVALTSFWVRLNWSHVVEIHAHVEIYTGQGGVNIIFGFG
jgi:hypothetical protein